VRTISYYGKHEIVKRNKEKLLVISSAILSAEPVRYITYAVLTTGSNTDNKGIFDREDIESIYLTDYLPNEKKDYQTIFITGIVNYSNGYSVKFDDIECKYFDERELLKPAKEHYEWRRGRWYNPKSRKYISV